MAETNFYEIKDYDINFSINDSTLTIRLHPDIDVMAVKKQIIKHQADAKNYEVMKNYLADVLPIEQVRDLNILLDPHTRDILKYLVKDGPVCSICKKKLSYDDNGKMGLCSNESCSDVEEKK